MTSTLQQRIRRVARRAGQLVRIYGVGWFAATACTAALVVGVMDYLVRFEDTGVRLICSLGLAAIVSWGFGRFVVRAWRYRCSELQAARRIEILYPQLGDRLTSAVAFAGGSIEDESLGSVELRRAVVAEAEAETAQIDFSACLDRRQPLRALLAAGTSLAMLAAVALVDPRAVTLAARRLVAPWQDHPWPRRHVLRWEDAPTRLAAGQDFEAKLSDAAGEPPDRVEIQYRFVGEEDSPPQTFQMQPFGKYLVHRLSNVTRAFQYRAVGGDDHTMGWTELVLVEPPRITSREITLHPPSYTGVEKRGVDGSFRALVGTRVTLRCRTSKPLSAAALETDTLGDRTSIPLTLDGDRNGFVLGDAQDEWVIRESGEYGFRLIDEDGLDIGVLDWWNIQAVLDQSPTVSLKRPASDLMVTPRALVTLEAIVKDDLAVRTVALHFLPSASTEGAEQIVPLWTGPERMSTPQDQQQQAYQEAEEEGVQKTIEHRWDLSLLPAMKRGEWMDFRVTAEDYAGQSAASGTRRLTFITAEELEERVAQRQSELLAEIAEIARLQRETLSQTASLRIQVQEVGRLEQGDVDQLQAAEWNQRQIPQRLGRQRDGVGAQLQQLIDQLRDNRVENPELASRLRQVAETIDQLERDPLLNIQHKLIDAIKIVREQMRQLAGRNDPFAARPRSQLIAFLEHAGAGQQQVVDTLQELLDRLSQWDSYQRLAREIGGLKREQEGIYDQTSQLRLETLTIDPNNMSAQQRATLKRLTQRQNDVVLRFGALTSNMEVAQQNLMPTDPRVAATLADALRMIYQKGVSGLIRDVGREMDRRRLGQAVAGQESVVELLGQLQDVLANRTQSQIDRRNQQLQEVSDDLQQVRDRQQAVRAQVEDAQSPDPSQFRMWSQEERELGAEVERIARQLQRQGNRFAQVPLESAGECLAGACQAAAAGDLEQTRTRAADAERALDQAQEAIDAALDAAEDARRDERASEIRQTVRSFLSRQQRFINDSQQAARQFREQGEEPDAQWQQLVRTLAGDQTSLAREVANTADSLSDVITFSFALRQSADLMDRAGESLASLDVSDDALRLQHRAAEQLEQLLAAMVDQPPDGLAADHQQPQPKDGQAGQNESAAARFLLPQLRLIRAMQLQLNRDTQLLQEAPQPWNEPVLARHQKLVNRQSRLAEMVGQLTGSAEDAGKPTLIRPPVEELESLDRALQEDERSPQ